ncbi:TetR family transcriptional regulator [Isoptericola sp. CG 20/1183]|uniref:TetR family transcriptional regulator n=1 Tax=Isoptericola halotolerans TaxID=300560 RepID=A0ABX5EAX4_9MICO|nr:MULTISPECIES: TetR/AcrR family transcriptional regulator [Isoptericola]PRZ04415.1 TetR family transcriptional regulator [Isoptericola halotolerans]PRZ04687.1 TetR family transcriptional regulator [Isoptericola sp. CG 20/1183]
MPWDTARTRERLLEAGSRQFAATGFAGTSVADIGRDSGVNKERLYAYFGSKREFFDHVLAYRLDGLLDDLDVPGTGPEAVGAWAGLLWDRYVADPDIARLLAWEGLELDGPAAAAHRTSACAEVTRRLQDVLPTADEQAARHLLLSVITLVTGAWTLSGLAALVTPADDRNDRRAATVRHAVVLARAVQTP